jgi:hypothetical protein
MLRFLKQPYPYFYNALKASLSAVGAGVFIFLFILIFQPFETNLLKGDEVLRVSLVSGMVTFVCVMMYILVIPLLFPAWFNEKVWMVGKELLLIFAILLTIGLMNFITAQLFFPNQLYHDISALQALWESLYTTFIVGALPTVLIVLINHIILLRKYYKGSVEVNECIKEHESRNTDAAPHHHHELVRILADSENDHFSVNPANLVAITASGNYVEYHHMVNGIIKRDIRRNTISNVEAQLQGHGHFLRTHRSWIVNLDMLEASHGNAQGYQLKMRQMEELIPVSRKNIAQFNAVMNEQRA